VHPDIYPYCAKCNKIVRRLEVFRDRKNSLRTYSVYCHGEVEKDTVIFKAGKLIKPGYIYTSRAFLDYESRR